MEQKREKRQRHFPRSGNIPPSTHPGISHAYQHQKPGEPYNPSSQHLLTREMHSQASGIPPEQSHEQLARCGTPAPTDHLTLVPMIPLENQRWWNTQQQPPSRLASPALQSNKAGKIWTRRERNTAQSLRNEGNWHTDVAPDSQD